MPAKPLPIKLWPRIENRPFFAAGILICPLAAAFKGWLGGVAATLFQLQWGIAFPYMRATALLLGLGGGLVSSLAWWGVMCLVAIREIRRTGRGSPRLIAWGAFLGHAAALTTTACLLGGMMHLAGRWPREAILLGLVYSAVAGLTFGALGGLILWGAAALAARRLKTPAAP